MNPIRTGNEKEEKGFNLGGIIVLFIAMSIGLSMIPMLTNQLKNTTVEYSDVEYSNESNTFTDYPNYTSVDSSLTGNYTVIASAIVENRTSIPTSRDCYQLNESTIICYYLQ